ncbi:MAG: MarR family transcriptional regulator [Desulfobacteraceae bacterium]|nr:MarR family transcriptional regulator [Desulfobacteraceae bacterium]
MDKTAVSAFLRILATGSEFLDRLDKVLANYGITHGRWLVLVLLRRREARQALPSELAQEQGITRATMSGLLRQLTRDDLVRRQEDPEDGRKSTIILTQKGADLVEQIMPAYYDLAKDLMAPLEDAEKSSLTCLLDKILMVKT